MDKESGGYPAPRSQSEYLISYNHSMANPEHLAILKQGVGVWNQWRAKHPAVRPDLSGEDFSHGWTASNVHYIFRDLPSAAFLDANFENVDLTHTQLHYADLRGANLVQADLSRANLFSAFLSGALIDGVNLRETNLSDARLIAPSSPTSICAALRDCSP